MMQVCTVARGNTAVTLSGQAFEPVTDQEEDVRDAAVLQIGEHRQPELRRLPATSAGPDPEDVRWPSRSTPIAA